MFDRIKFSVNCSNKLANVIVAICDMLLYNKYIKIFLGEILWIKRCLGIN